MNFQEINDKLLSLMKEYEVDFANLGSDLDIEITGEWLKNENILKHYSPEELEAAKLEDEKILSFQKSILNALGEYVVICTEARGVGCTFNERQTIIHFKDHNVYVGCVASYDSWNGTNWDYTDSFQELEMYMAPKYRRK